MPEYLAPGVYVEETSFRSKSIEGVSTTTTGFVGPTRYGPHDKVPDIITNLAEYERIYGDGEQLRFVGITAPVHNFMWHAVRAFFQNGGQRLYIVRLLDASAVAARGPVTPVAPAVALTGDGNLTTFAGIQVAAAPIVPGSVQLRRQDPKTSAVKEDLQATVNGVNTVFTRTLAHLPDAADVKVEWQGQQGGNPRTFTQTIAGNVATGDGAPAQTTLDRSTGQLHLDTTGSLATSGAITVSYEWSDGRVFGDNRDGQIVGQAGATGVLGTVDYDSGMLGITFTAAPANGQAWTLAYSTAAGEVVARFPGAAGNGVLRFEPRAGQNLIVGNQLAKDKNGDDAVVDGDFVEVLAIGSKPEWRQAVKGLAGFTFTRFDGSDARALGAFVRVAKAASVTVSFTRAGQREPAGVWEGLAPTTDAITGYFQAHPSSDELARTLPVIIASLSPRTIHGGSIELIGGTDGIQPTNYEGREDPVTDVKTGLVAFEDLDDIAIIAAPGLAGLTGSAIDTGVLAVQAHVEKMRYRVAVLDSVKGHSIGEVRQFKARFDSKHMAFYYPWVRVLDPITRAEIDLPPSGFLTGIYARNDVNRAVYKAPANEVVNLALGFERTLSKDQQAVLNPEGINCLRFFEGRGMRVWGARTISSDPEWKYINVRRYFAYLEHSIDLGTQWAVFEPNGPLLWANVRRTIEEFLLNEFQSGALLGTKPENSFFVRCDRTTMTQNDLDNGRLICLVGVAPLKPAEFVVFRIGQWTADAKS